MGSARARALGWASALGGCGVDPRLLVAAPGQADEPKRLTERIGERVSRGVVEESLEVLDDPSNRARLGRIVNSPQMRTAMHDLTVSIVLGAVDGLARADFGELDVARAVGHRRRGAARRRAGPVELARDVLLRGSESTPARAAGAR
ncbi:MAG: hypothetical protein JNK45_17265 [Myxococcales bacterium]|nr:hypothetical protein [Myxococcales bacterium]